MERILQLDPIIYSNTGGWSPLHWAARSGNIQLFKLLRDAGVAESTCDTVDPPNSWTSLKVAIFHRNESLAAYIRTVADDIHITHEHPKVEVKVKQPLIEDSLSAQTEEVLPFSEGECNGCFNVSHIR
jgi:ankyrin repeat protein